MAAAEQTVPRELRRDKKTPHNSLSTFIVDKKGGSLAKAVGGPCVWRHGVVEVMDEHYRKQRTEEKIIQLAKCCRLKVCVFFTLNSYFYIPVDIQHTYVVSVLIIFPREIPAMSSQNFHAET